MSEENVEIVRRAYEAFLRGQWHQVAQLHDPDVVLLHEFRRGRGSGVELETDTAVVVEVRNGLVVRLQGYMHRAEALQAAGLGE